MTSYMLIMRESKACSRMVFTKPLLAEQRALAVFLRKEKGYSYSQIALKTGMSKSSVRRVLLERKSGTSPEEKRSRGRPQLLSSRDKRMLRRAIAKLRQEDPNFTAMNIVEKSGVGLSVASYRTFVRQINRMGYAFRQSRKKGLLSTRDHKIRLAYARTMKKKTTDYWGKDVSFYLDGVSFVFKSNPLSDARKAQGRVWRKRSEGLQITTKGSKDLAGGKRIHFIVAIAFGKGVILAEQYEKMNAEYFASFIRRNFPNLFEIAGKGAHDAKVFVMDNDPSQTSAKARVAMEELGVTMQKIPPRSPDLNPIENMFHEVRKRLKLAAKQNNVEHQTWEEFVNSVKFHIWSTPKSYINKTILSMPKRMEEICKRKGLRTKY